MTAHRASPEVAGQSSTAFAGNPRVHSAEQVARIAASITEFGFTNPILIPAMCSCFGGKHRLVCGDCRDVLAPASERH